MIDASAPVAPRVSGKRLFAYLAIIVASTAVRLRYAWAPITILASGS